MSGHHSGFRKRDTVSHQSLPVLFVSDLVVLPGMVVPIELDEASRAAIDAVNGVDEAITVATLAPYKPVVAGEMVATVKIIPYAVPGAALDRACGAAPAGALAVSPAGSAASRVGVTRSPAPTLAVITARASGDTSTSPCPIIESACAVPSAVSGTDPKKAGIPMEASTPTPRSAAAPANSGRASGDSSAASRRTTRAASARPG